MRAVRRLRVVLLSASALVAPGSPRAATAVAAETSAPGSTYTPLAAPERILDTRTTVGGHQRALTPGETIALPVRGVAGVPADATAVMLNVTGVAPDTDTYLRVTPDGHAGTFTRANVTVTGIGGDGAVRISHPGGSTRRGHQP